MPRRHSLNASILFMLYSDRFHLFCLICVLFSLVISISHMAWGIEVEPLNTHYNVWILPITKNHSAGWYVSGSGQPTGHVNPRVGSTHGSGLPSTHGSGRPTDRVYPRIGSTLGSWWPSGRVDQRIGSTHGSCWPTGRVDPLVGSDSSESRIDKN
jgi:hypothetical protein